MEAPQNSNLPSNSSIWTVRLERNFYYNIAQLLSRKINQPQLPQYPPLNEIRPPEEYLLGLKDELCFADQVAFLASFKEGVGYVSAATIQERKTPSAILIRLASNETIEPFVIQKLEDIFKVMEAYASRRMHREECQSQLFNTVLILSSERIHGRLCSSRWKRPAHRQRLTQQDAPLHQRLQQFLEKLVTKIKIYKQELKELRQKLKELCSYYLAIDQDDVSLETELLKEAIRKTHEISTANGNSLETSLKRMGVEKALCEGRIILQIDKIGRYWGLCKFLTHLCRQPKYRQLFRDIKLETCSSFGCLYRLGKSRFVHAEIQVILSLEKEQMIPFPRAIGASKSACYLCNLFIHKHGTFHLSHSHNTLYDQWTLPELPWMNDSQRNRFRTILTEMTKETQRLLHQINPGNTYAFQNIQSRAHLLLQTEGPETPSEITILSDMKALEESRTIIQASPVPTVYSSEQSLTSTTSINSTASASTIKSADYPIQHLITPASKPLKISNSRTELFFHFTDVKSGSLAITRSDSEKRQSIDIRSLPTDRDISFEPGAGQDEMVLHMLDGSHSLFDLIYSWT